MEGKMTTPLELNEILNKFARSRQLLQEFYSSSLQHFDQLKAILCNEFNQSAVDSNLNLFLTPEEQKYLDKVVHTDPVIILSGQTNSGKTSLINELFSGSFFPTSALPCTARVVKIHYSETNELRIIGNDGKELQKTKFDKKVAKDLIALDSTSRKEKDIECTVEVGLNHDLLKHGLKIVDVPGLSENESLDNLVKKSLDGMLQLLIYVIDGKTSLRQQDCEFLSHLKNIVPSVEIMYVCNKVEDDPVAREMDRFSDEEENDDEVIDRAKLAFDKLKRFHFLPQDIEYSPDLEQYHGLSCKKIRRARLKQEQGKPDEFTEKFEIFKNVLLKRFGECVDKHLKQAVFGLLRSQQRLFDFFISEKMIQLPKSELSRQIQSIKNHEHEFQQQLGHEIKTRWLTMTSEIINRNLENMRDAILESVESLEFKPIALTDHSSKTHVIDMCRLQVRDHVLMMVAENIDKELRCLESWLQQEAEKHKKKTSHQSNDAESRVNYILYNHIGTIWNRENMNFDVGALKNNWVAGLRHSVKTRLKQTTENLKLRLRGIYLDETWKRDTAADVLRSICPNALAQHIIRSVQESLKKDHDEFNSAMQQIETLLKLKEKQAHAHRSQVKNMIPEFSRNLTVTEALSNVLTHGRVTIGEEIGEGSRMKVFQCKRWNDRDDLVAKKQKPPSANPNPEFCKNFIYSRLLSDHKSYVKVVGVVFDQDWHFCILVPKYQSTLYDFLLQHNLPLEKRIKICQEIAQVCDFVKMQRLTLNDLRLNNFLVERDGDELHIAYNLSKWKDMAAPYPDRLPPFHFAPETLLNVHVPINKNDSSFSLTVLLLQLIIGKPVRPKFCRSTEAFEEFKEYDKDKIIQTILDDFQALLDEYWEDKKHPVYEIVKQIIVKHLGQKPSEREPVHKFTSNVQHLMNRLKEPSSDDVQESDDNGTTSETAAMAEKIAHAEVHDDKAKETPGIVQKISDKSEEPMDTNVSGREIHVKSTNNINNLNEPMDYREGFENMERIRDENAHGRQNRQEFARNIETDTPADDETDTPADDETDTPADDETDTPADDETENVMDISDHTNVPKAPKREMGSKKLSDFNNLNDAGYNGDSMQVSESANNVCDSPGEMEIDRNIRADDQTEHCTEQSQYTMMGHVDSQERRKPTTSCATRPELLSDPDDSSTQLPNKTQKSKNQSSVLSKN